MEKRSTELIIRALNEGRVQYLVVGGLAVVAHGYVRFTADLDLMLAMDASNLAASIAALKKLNYRPRAPVPLDEFADADTRRKWIDEKGLTDFSLYSPDHPATEIDLFVDPPLAFAEAYSRAASMELAPGLAATICSLPDLIDLKLGAGRPRDKEDIAELERLHREDS